MTNSVSVSMRVNGEQIEGEAEPRMTLTDFLRATLNLTGTHLGCEHGVCGACTIILNGASVRSCLMFAVQANGGDITTVEGLATGDQLTPLQQAFHKHHALQCGFCTPGILTTAHAFLAENPRPTREEVIDAISGSICRCTGYVPIVDAILEASVEMQS